MKTPISVAISTLLPDEHNPRQRTERGEEVLDHSLREYGPARSIVIDGDGVVRAGNGTLEAAKKAGISKVIVVDGDKDTLIAVRRADWSDEKAQAYSVMDNKAGDLAVWNYPVLDDKLRLPDLQPENLGFLQSEVDSIRANASWMGTGDGAADGGVGKKAAEAFTLIRFQVTVLDQSKADEAYAQLEEALACFKEGIILEKL